MSRGRSPGQAIAASVFALAASHARNRGGDCRKIGGRNHFRALNGVVPDVCRDCLVSDSGQHQLLLSTGSSPNRRCRRDCQAGCSVCRLCTAFTLGALRRYDPQSCGSPPANSQGLHPAGAGGRTELGHYRGPPSARPFRPELALLPRHGLGCGEFSRSEQKVTVAGFGRLRIRPMHEHDLSVVLMHEI